MVDCGPGIIYPRTSTTVQVGELRQVLVLARGPTTASVPNTPSFYAQAHPKGGDRLWRTHEDVRWEAGVCEDFPVDVRCLVPVQAQAGKKHEVKVPVTVVRPQEV